MYTVCRSICGTKPLILPLISSNDSSLALQFRVFVCLQTICGSDFAPAEFRAAFLRVLTQFSSSFRFGEPLTFTAAGTLFSS